MRWPPPVVPHHHLLDPHMAVRFLSTRTSLQKLRVRADIRGTSGCRELRRNRYRSAWLPPPSFCGDCVRPLFRWEGPFQPKRQRQALSKQEGALHCTLFCARLGCGIRTIQLFRARENALGPIGPKRFRAHCTVMPRDVMGARPMSLPRPHFVPSGQACGWPPPNL